MKDLSARFMSLAAVYGLVGFGAGVYMGITGNFAITSAHAHLTLLGWLSFAVFAFYYHQHPQAGGSKLAVLHFWGANLGLVIMTVAVAVLHSGHQGAAPAAGIGSIILLVSFILFCMIVYTHTYPGRIHEKRRTEQEAT